MSGVPRVYAYASISSGCNLASWSAVSIAIGYHVISIAVRAEQGRAEKGRKEGWNTGQRFRVKVL